ncbi:hypothetical protein QBC34DRAFT_153894 [Podospora aff. communis PSN243]|uniref:Zn(2)-C6 fungal-type domain-containing protein n=1 Tax=Podospora aff. communis PSN243 TaxID=3040156 RepID=A0AAV9GBQ9_9PEZI|nr:hypothetical protein QBC34DRAFT_153894 [Podospora aff. communis PSN243]
MPEKACQVWYVISVDAHIPHPEIRPTGLELRTRPDRGQPTCRRCLASGHRCDGYDTTLRMHNLGTRPVQGGVPRMTVITPESSVEKPVDLPGPAPSDPSHAVLPEDAARAASYFFSTCVWAPFWRSLLLSTTSGEAEDSLVIGRACFDALVCGYTGLAQEDVTLQDKARQLYARVLGQTREAVIKAEKSKLVKLTRAIAIMAMYEFTVHRDVGGSPPHHLGISWILQHCGPESFQDSELLHVFRSCRAMLTCQSIWRRSRCFLEDEQWKRVPWQNTPKTFEDRIMDVFINLPGLSEDMAVPERLINAKERVHASMDALQTWRQDWDASYSPHTKPPPKNDKQDSIHPLFRDATPTRLRFDSPTRALEILLYNSALLYLMQLLEVATRRIAALSPPPLDPTTPKPDAFLLTNPRSSRIQPALEGLHALSAMPELCSATEEKVTIVTPAPMAILYWAVQGMPELTGSWDVFLSRCRGFDEAQTEFEGFKIGVWT